MTTEKPAAIEHGTPAQPVVITAMMRSAYERVKLTTPAVEFRPMMESYVKGILTVATQRGITPRKAAVLMVKHAQNKGQRTAADQVFAAFVWMEEALTPANDSAPTIIMPEERAK